MAPRLIAFSGYIGAGKSTAASVLAEHGFVVTKFATPLKAMLVAVGLTVRDLEDPILKSQPHPLLCGRTPRHAMVTLGTEWGRDLIGPDFWAGLWSARARHLLTSGNNVVVDDMRFPNEVEAVNALGGQAVYIIGVRNSQPQLQHRSEDGSMRGRCMTLLYNTGTLAKLREDVLKLLAA